MAGKKRSTKKAASTKAKTSAKTKSLAVKTEQILLSMPRIIAAQISKDLAVLKKQESKIKKDLHRLESKNKKSLKSLKVSKSKALQKSLQKDSQQLKLLTKALSTLYKQAEDLMQKRDKYLALQAELTRFQKEWAKRGAKIKSKSTSSATKLTESPRFSEESSRSKAVQVVDVIELPLEEELALT